MLRPLHVLGGLTVFAITATALGQAGQSVTVEAYEYRDFPIHVDVPELPAPVPMHDGRWLLVYHLFLSSWGYTPLTLEEFQVLDAHSKAVVLRHDERELSERSDNGSRFPTAPAGRALRPGHGCELAPGESAAIVAFVWFDSRDDLNASQGQPYVFERFELEGIQPDWAPLEDGAKPSVCTASLPADGSVVWFGDGD